jgi:hypothetical protein
VLDCSVADLVAQDAVERFMLKRVRKRRYNP